jgi:tRNA(Ile)-lysidine synthase
MSAAATTFLASMATAWPVTRWGHQRIVVATSGGADSVALACGLAELIAGPRASLILAHLHHNRRGVAADRDQSFVAALAAQLACSFETDRVPASAYDDLERIGFEATARRLRYDFLRRTAARYNAPFVVTAHTLDDQAETVLHRIVRGTGLRGVASILRADELLPGVQLVRPLLSIRRQAAREYLAQIGQAFREDETNRDLTFTRNRIRAELVPLLESSFNPRAAEALANLAQSAQDLRAYLEPILESLQTQVTRPADDGALHWNCSPLLTVPDFLLRELLQRAWQQQGWPMREMDATHWNSLVELIRAARGARDLPGALRAEKRREVLTLTRIPPR